MIQNGRVQTSIKYLLKFGNSFFVYTGRSSSLAMEVSVSEGLSCSFAGVVALWPRRSKHGIPLLEKLCGSEALLQWMHLAEGLFCLPQIHGFHDGHVIQWSTALSRVQPCRCPSRHPSSAEPKHSSDSYIISSLDIKKNVHSEWLMRKCLIIIS